MKETLSIQRRLARWSKRVPGARSVLRAAKHSVLRVKQVLKGLEDDDRVYPAEIPNYSYNKTTIEFIGQTSCTRIAEIGIWRAVGD